MFFIIHDKVIDIKLKVKDLLNTLNRTSVSFFKLFNYIKSMFFILLLNLNSSFNLVNENRNINEKVVLNFND